MATTNGRYAAYARHGDIYIENISSSEPERTSRCLSPPPPQGHVVLEFSVKQPHLLAVSSGSQILIFNVVEHKLQSTISGNGRIITALCWSAQKDSLLSGTIDGRVSLWSLEASGPPVAQLRLHGACQAIACCSTDSGVVATVHDGKIVIAKHSSGASWRILRTVALEGDRVTSISWHPSQSGRLLSGAESGRVYVWNVSATLKSTSTLGITHDSDSSDSEEGFFGSPDDVNNEARKPFDIASPAGLSYIHWTHGNTFICLDSDGTRCSFWTLGETAKHATQIWKKELVESASSASVALNKGMAYLVAVSPHGAERIPIPESVAKEACMLSSEVHIGLPSLSSVEVDGRDQKPRGTGGMKPISISTLRAKIGSFEKTSKQLQRRRASFERRREKVDDLKAKIDAKQHNPPSPPPPVSMTSSLELPKQTDDDGSPMPFLSPSIPSQRPSPGALSPLDDSVKLPPLPRASFDSSMHSMSAATQESDDSDDETFVDGMQGSASFLPGGINVPLPKACAALFTPTGELLTFFPPKPEYASRKGDVVEERQADPKENAKKVARLFPTFGNLAGDPQHLDDDDDAGFESTSSVSADGGPLRLQPSFSFYPSSFPSQQSWKARISPTKHSFTEQSPYKVIVSLHDIQDVGSVLPASRELASRYRILCEQGETGANLCEDNAKVAEALDLADTACIWRLVALLLDGRVPLELIHGSRRGVDILAIARVANRLPQDKSLRPSSRDQQHQLGKLRWANNPFGAAWVVQAVFDWAEVNSDTQVLALLSAILAGAQQLPASNGYVLGQGMTTCLPSYQDDYFSATDGSDNPRRLTTQSIPILRTNSVGTSNAVYESPVKLKRSSTASSRNPSQPPTPYLESESSTPPFSMQSLGRQNTRLSISGSASPEHHRSSFSAAAKYYAQSISDKFASYGAYGTSPPARKMGTSPSNTNELSTSFPAGSWGKSVSFASTTNTATTRASILGTSFEDVQEDEGYDSDKTVEDLSQPQTPKENSECVVTFKNDRLFDDDTSGGSHATLLTDELVTKCRLWCDYYAEQLRCWDLLAQAAELEKVCGMTCLRKPSDNTMQEDADGLVPNIPAHGSKACSICSIKMTGAQVFCSQCSHSAHLGCLEDFITAMCVDDKEDFACPAGCGCQCDDLGFETTEAVKEAVREERPKKKASFTDPRRWRATIEGDSW